MALQIGTRIGPFEVTDILGAGGVGEVYRARDSKLGRDVVKSELLYQSGDQVIAVPLVATGETWEPGKPVVRIEKLGGQQWDLAANVRIALVAPVVPLSGKAAPPENTIAMVQNFFDEVRRRVK